LAFGQVKNERKKAVRGETERKY